MSITYRSLRIVFIIIFIVGLIGSSKWFISNAAIQGQKDEVNHRMPIDISESIYGSFLKDRLRRTNISAGLVSQNGGGEHNSRTVINPLAASVVATIPVGLGGIGPFDVGVNPTTNRIYVPNVHSNNVTVIDGATNNVIGNPIPVGSSPFGVGVNSTTNRIYVANFSESTVSVIDGATNTVIGGIGDRIFVGAGPTAIAVNPITNRIYVANFAENTVSVINGATNTIIGNPIPVGNFPVGIGVNPITNRIYVANNGTFSNASNTVSVIDGTANTVIGNIIVLGAAGPSGIGINPTTNRIYIANEFSDNVSVIDGDTNIQIGDPIPVGSNPIDISVNPTTNRIYVSNLNIGNFRAIDDTVSVIDGATNTVIGNPIRMASNPTGIGVNPNTNRIYVAIVESNVVSVIDGSTNTLTGNPVACGSGPIEITVNPTTNRVYSANTNGTASVIDGVTNFVIGQPVSVGRVPVGIVVNPTTNRIYVTNFNDSTVSIINGATNTIIGNPISVGNRPTSVRINPATNRVYVVNRNDNIISVIDGVTNTIIGQPITLGSSPIDLGVNPTTNRIYVTTVGGTVSVIDGATSSVIGNPISVGSNKIGSIGINSTTNRIYVATNNTITVIDGANNTVIGQPIAIISPAFAIGINSTTNRIYVANNNSSTVTVIDGVTNNVIGNPIPVGNFPFGIGVNPITNRIYVANLGSDTVTVIEDLPSCATITLSPNILPSGTAGVNYTTTTITASGGTGPYTFTVTSGNLPSGLSLDSNTGILSGTPASTGIFNFTVTASDTTSSCTGTKDYSITVACPTITLTPSTLPPGTTGVNYTTTTITANGGIGPYTFSVPPNTLPPGFSLNASTGVISGTPTSTGTFNFTITAADAATGCTGTKNYSISIDCPTITLSPNSLPNGAVGANYSTTITASGGTAPYTFTLSNALGFALISSTSNTATISGTPTAKGVFTFTVTAKDANNCSASQNYSITVSQQPSITSFSPTSGSAGTQIFIFGTNFLGASSVKFNGANADFTFNTDTQIMAVVPSGATTGFITVANPAGVATSPGFFTVTVPGPPAIASFTPLSGPPGTNVTINGSQFAGATSVKFNGVSASFTVNSTGTQIFTSVPLGATTGKISVTTSVATAVSVGTFTVTTPLLPVISSFAPLTGSFGTNVTINGLRFTGATDVKFNGVSASFTVNSTGAQIFTSVPQGATTGKISVTTPAATVLSAGTFTVIPQRPPTIASFSPTSGLVGTLVTINGTEFTGATAVRFNGVSAANFTVVSSTQIRAVVPAGATTGRVSVTTPVATATSIANFTVTGPCFITPIGIGQTVNGTLDVNDCRSPVRGGSFFADRYTFTAVAGTNLAVALTASFNSYVYLIGPNGAVIAQDDNGGGGTNSRIPATSGFFALTATGTYTVEVTSANPDGVGNYILSLIPAGPIVSSVLPGSGIVGTTVTITGSNFTGASVVKFNGVKAVTDFISTTTLRAIAPVGATTGFISVITANGTAMTASNFIVLTAGSTCIVTPINLGQTVSGTLAVTDCRSPARGSTFFADRYSFTSGEGQRISITLSSGNFDAYLYLIGPNGVTALDDDGAGAGNSQITFTVQTTGTYIIEATSANPNDAGNYLVSLGIAPQTAASRNKRDSIKRDKAVLIKRKKSGSK